MSDPSKAIARYDGPKSIDELARYARLLAGGDGAPINGSLPAAYRGNPAALAFAVEYAKALDVSPITAVTGIHNIDGKPSASAGLISALIRRAGHKLRVGVEGNIDDLTLRAWATIHRADDPDHEYRVEWDLYDAERADLLQFRDGKIFARTERGKPTQWEKGPRAMLKARAITEVAREAAEDVLLGVHYTPEELGAEVDEGGDPVVTVTRLPDPPQPAPPSPAGPAKDGAPEEKTTPQKGTQPPGEDVDQVAGMTADQWRTAILEASELGELMDLWTRAAPNQSETLGRMLTADEDMVETTVLDLFQAQGNAIKGGSPLRDRDAKLAAVTTEATKPPPVDVEEGVVVAKAFFDDLVGKLDTFEVHSLIGWGKRHNLRMDTVESLDRLTGAAFALIAHRPQTLEGGQLPHEVDLVDPDIIDGWVGPAKKDDPGDAQTEALVADQLGGTVIESHTLTAAERKAALDAAAEDRELDEKARTATPDPPPPPTGDRVKSRAAEARSAIKKGKSE